MTTFEVTIIFFVAIITVLLALIYGESAYRTNELNKKIDRVRDSLIAILTSIKEDKK